MSAAALDPRITPARPDLAWEGVRDQVAAPRYVAGELRRVTAPVAPLRRHPAGDAPLDSEALLGESVRVLEEDAEGWAWAQLLADGYVGYLPAEALAPLAGAPTHKVVALRTFLFPGPDIKLPPIAALPFGARVSVNGERERFLVTGEGFLFSGHLAPINRSETDPVAVAARFVGTPYLWGGRSSLGLDCSGLVQTALNACGIAAPRDSDMQERALGAPAALDGPFRRGDLLFWPGHVAIAEAPDTLLHANAFHMAVAREPLGPALERIAAAGSALMSVRRL
ncbi:C40 family peptidase [Xanthobacter pseudotagetidis]|uniref:C40 family peptidase n=1 Tax=Xanthobacter pseudotagetidis TaxID=3119911 RepID=UPI00372647CA